nr:hypothetical protein CFP56_20549 [Quercus suber]
MESVRSRSHGRFIADVRENKGVKLKLPESTSTRKCGCSESVTEIFYEIVCFQRKRGSNFQLKTGSLALQPTASHPRCSAVEFLPGLSLHHRQSSALSGFEETNDSGSNEKPLLFREEEPSYQAAPEDDVEDGVVVGKEQSRGRRTGVPVRRRHTPDSWEVGGVGGEEGEEEQQRSQRPFYGRVVEPVTAIRGVEIAGAQAQPGVCERGAGHEGNGGTDAHRAMLAG